MFKINHTYINIMYAKTGSSGLEGNLYQIKLVTFYLLKLLRKCLSEEAEIHFNLANEFPEGGKFDDIYFEYGSSCYFLQAKHKKNSDEIITIDDLITQKDTNYTMVKYFFSHQDIVNSKKYKKRAINVCLFTNIDLASNVKEYVCDAGDNIFTVEHDKSKYYKFTRGFAVELQPILNEYHLRKLATNLAKSIVAGDGIRVQEPAIKVYHPILMAEVVDSSTKPAKFRSTFINNDVGLLPTTGIFREFLISEISNAFTKKKIIPLELPEIRFNIAKIKNKSSVSSDWPESVMSLESIQEFFEQLIVAVLQPNEEEMDDVILREMNEVIMIIEKSVKCGSIKIAKDQLIDIITNWCKSPEGIFLTFEKGEEILRGIFHGIKLMIATDKKEYCDELKSFSLDFAVNNLKEVIHDFMTTDKHNILHIQTLENPKLSAIKVFKALESLSDVSYHFQSLLQLVKNDEEFTNFIDLFNVIEDVHMLVLECPMMANSDITLKQATRLLEKHVATKIVLIGHREQNFIKQQLARNLPKFRIQENINNFRDFTRHSQDVLMNQKVKLGNCIVELRSVIDLQVAIKSFDEIIIDELIKKEICVIEGQLRRLNLRDLNDEVRRICRQTHNEAKRVEKKIRNWKF